MCLQNCYFKGYIAFLCVDVVIRALNCKWQKPSLNKNRDLMAYVTGADMSGRDVRIQDSDYVFRDVPAECLSLFTSWVCLGIGLAWFCCSQPEFPHMAGNVELYFSNPWQQKQRNVFLTNSKGKFLGKDFYWLISKAITVRCGNGTIWLATLGPVSTLYVWKGWRSDREEICLAARNHILHRHCILGFEAVLVFCLWLIILRIPSRMLLP